MFNPRKKNIPLLKEEVGEADFVFLDKPFDNFKPLYP